ncbi:MAG: phenylalanine--tRNA ligase subunit beta [Acetilactobacillus jinshanensis]
MRLSYDWLKKYLDINVPVKQLAEKIERTVVEYDDIIEPSKGLKKIVVGKILSCKKHPNADHLHICQVDVGADQPLQIICGAPNVRAGKKGIVAVHGARVGSPGNVKIKRAKMRGVRSNGMLCALDEIGFDKAVVPDKWQDGIYYLPDDAKVGAPVYPYLGMDDQIIDLSVTPNRGDMLSMNGIVHELAAIYNKKPNFTKPEVKEDPSHHAKDEIEATADSKIAPIDKLRVVNDVKVQDSPLWLQIRLWNCGIQPVNNVVDVTNYIMLKYGQPVHAFDLDKLAGSKLVARHAQKGEKFINNDKKSVELDPKDIVVADANQPLSLAGVSGGLKANVTSQTKNIVLEAAAFDPIMVRMTSRRHSIHTESSKRFERGVDHAGVGEALNDAAQRFRTDLSKDTVADIFRRLGFKDQVKGDQFTVTVPPRRWDITIAPDLYEEIAKLYGYNKIPSTLPGGRLTVGELTPKQKVYRKSRQVLEGAGLSHAISYTLTTSKKARMFMLRNEAALSNDR